MLAAQIIRNLPGSLDWTVLFDLSTLRGLVADETVRAIRDLRCSTRSVGQVVKEALILSHWTV